MRARQAFAIGAMLGGAFVAVVLRVKWLSDRTMAIDWPVTFGALSDIAQTIALLVAGIWTYRLFVKQLMDRVRADVSLHVTCPTHDDTTRLLRVYLEIKNVGNVELRPHNALLYVQAVRRSGDGVALPMDADGKPVLASDSFDKWPELATCTVDLLKDELTMEPGETERYPFDFIIPGNVSVIQVHAVVRGDGAPNGEYWDDTVVCSLEQSAAS